MAPQAGREMTAESVTRRTSEETRLKPSEGSSVTCQAGLHAKTGSLQKSGYLHQNQTLDTKGLF